MNDDRIFFNYASQLAAEIAFSGSEQSGKELCRLQSEAAENHLMMSSQELPFLAANGFSRLERESDDAKSTYVLKEAGGPTFTTVVQKDGLRTVKAVWPDGSEASGESRRSVMDAAFDCLRGTSRPHTA